MKVKKQVAVPRTPNLSSCSIGWQTFAASCALLGVTPAWSAMVVTPNVSTSALASALGGSGLTIDSVNITNGTVQQFGTYSGFSLPPVKISDGIVLSSGLVEQTPAPASDEDIPDNPMGSGGTTEFDAYGAGNIESFEDSHDVARLEVKFTLSAASPVSFDFVFGSIEYPNFTSRYTDAFLAFLDGTSASNQVAFDQLNNPVQVGVSFESQLTTGDQNTAFSDPHGLLSSLTTTAVLTAGSHTLLFEVGDVNDELLDSAAFIANFRTSNLSPGTIPTPPSVPIPAAVWLFGSAVFGMGIFGKRKMAR